MRFTRDDDSGFTLIELLIVIIIIGILSAIAIPTFLKQREKAWRAGALSDMKNASLAIEGYATDFNGSYTAVNGANENSAIFVGEGFHASDWVQLAVVSSDNQYCIQGESVNLPGKTFIFTSLSGTVTVDSTGSATC